MAWTPWTSDREGCLLARLAPLGPGNGPTTLELEALCVHCTARQWMYTLENLFSESDAGLFVKSILCDELGRRMGVQEFGLDLARCEAQRSTAGCVVRDCAG